MGKVLESSKEKSNGTKKETQKCKLCDSKADRLIVYQSVRMPSEGFLTLCGWYEGFRDK
jgi:hypothetical protein